MTHDVRGLSIERDPSRIPPPGRRIGTRVVLPLALLTATVGTALFAARDTLWPAPAVVVEPVVVALAGDEPAALTAVTAPGWIAPDPFAIQVVAMTAGVVAEVLALDGARVEAGEVVARLIQDDALLAVERARAQRDAAQAALRQTEAERPAIAAAIAAADASIEAARVELELKEPLANEQLLSNAEIARLRARIGIAEADAMAARARTPVLDARLDHARAQLAIADVELRTAELRLSRTEVCAPVAGIVLRRVAAPGTVLGTPGISAGSVVLELYDPARLMARVDVPFVDAGHIGVGQRATITVEALPERHFDGVVIRAVQSADIAKNTVSFHVALATTDPTLRPDMIARVRLLAAAGAETRDQERRTLFVPRDAIRAGGDHVFVVATVDGSRARAERRRVTPGATRDGYVAVDGDVRPGDRVVIDGPIDLVDGQLVEVVAPGGPR